MKSNFTHNVFEKEGDGKDVRQTKRLWLEPFESKRHKKIVKMNQKKWPVKFMYNYVQYNRRGLPKPQECSAESGAPTHIRQYTRRRVCLKVETKKVRAANSPTCPLADLCTTMYKKAIATMQFDGILVFATELF